MEGDGLARLSPFLTQLYRRRAGRAPRLLPAESLEPVEALSTQGSSVLGHDVRDGVLIFQLIADESMEELRQRMIPISADGPS